ncbi:hypothetical protein NGA74_05510, partial [Lactobacillus helveticus]|uniref:hypothetical protein n=1 Tax=Lactobacillus helveticus TaxID=1587 RepID=UPI00207D6005
FLFKIISNICLRKKGGTSKKTKKGRIHHGIKIPCFLRQLINKALSYCFFINNYNMQMKANSDGMSGFY